MKKYFKGEVLDCITTTRNPEVSDVIVSIIYKWTHLSCCTSYYSRAECQFTFLLHFPCSSQLWAFQSLHMTCFPQDVSITKSHFSHRQKIPSFAWTWISEERIVNSGIQAKLWDTIISCFRQKAWLQPRKCFIVFVQYVAYCISFKERYFLHK